MWGLCLRVHLHCTSPVVEHNQQCQSMNGTFPCSAIHPVLGEFGPSSSCMSSGSTRSRQGCAQCTFSQTRLRCVEDCYHWVSTPLLAVFACPPQKRFLWCDQHQTQLWRADSVLQMFHMCPSGCKVTFCSNTTPFSTFFCRGSPHTECNVDVFLLLRLPFTLRLLLFLMTATSCIPAFCRTLSVITL